ncbi:hypothetical protein L204_101725 [Cryptococcus depauperatus]
MISLYTFAFFKHHCSWHRSSVNMKVLREKVAQQLRADKIVEKGLKVWQPRRLSNLRRLSQSQSERFPHGIHHGFHIAGRYVASSCQPLEKGKRRSKDEQDYHRQHNEVDASATAVIVYNTFNLFAQGFGIYSNFMSTRVLPLHRSHSEK